MKVFISWSGEKSKKVGDLLDDWLQCVIQAIDPWMSSKDIDRGALWFSEITGQLQDTPIGIICLTKENQNKPWILFEAGALAKGLSSSRVCTLLIDLDPIDIKDPLAQFNHTIPNENGIWELVRTLNTYLGDKGLKEKVLEQVFKTYWPSFKSKFQEIIQEIPAVEEERRTEDDILKELLSLTRNMDKRIRNLEVDKIDKKKFSSSNSLKVNSEIKDYLKRSITQGESEGRIIDTLMTVFGFGKLDAEIAYSNEYFNIFPEESMNKF